MIIPDREREQWGSPGPALPPSAQEPGPLDDAVLSRQERQERWLICGRRVPDARARVYCFPHAGGSGGEYAQWYCPDGDIEIWGVRLPGRGRRLREPAHRRLDELVTAVLKEIDFQPPFGLFGHSLGALVAFEVARRLRVLRRPGPDRLWVSACPAPHLPRPEPPIAHLPDRELLDLVATRHGAMPEEIRSNREFADLVVPSLRADHELVETYVYRDGEPLTCPVHVLCGTDDVISEERLSAWADLTASAPSFRAFSGGHFYLTEHRHEVCRLISETMWADSNPSRPTERTRQR